MLENDQLISRMMSRVDLATKAVDRLNDAKKTIERVQEMLKDKRDDTTAAVKYLKEKSTAFLDSIKTLTGLVNEGEVQGFKDTPGILRPKLEMADWHLNSSWIASSPNDKLVLQQAEEGLQKVLSRVNGFFEKSWPEYQQVYKEANLSLFEGYEPLKF
jgi:hypothetical protein